MPDAQPARSAWSVTHRPPTRRRRAWIACDRIGHDLRFDDSLPISGPQRSTAQCACTCTFEAIIPPYRVICIDWATCAATQDMHNGKPYMSHVGCGIHEHDTVDTENRPNLKGRSCIPPRSLQRPFAYFYTATPYLFRLRLLWLIVTAATICKKAS